MGLTPEQLAKPQTEHAQQVAFFCMLNANVKIDYRLKYVFAIPNGGKREIINASRLKAEGLKSGVPDIFAPIPTWHRNKKGLSNFEQVPLIKYCGLWIEMKKPDLDGTDLKGEQFEWEIYLQSQKYCHRTAFTYCQAWNHLVNYLSQDTMSPSLERLEDDS